MKKNKKADLLKKYKTLYEVFEKKRLEHDSLYSHMIDFFNENSGLMEELSKKTANLSTRLAELEELIEPVRQKVKLIRWEYEFKKLKKEGIMLFHPDRHGGSNQSAHELFVSFNEAVKQKDLEQMQRIIDEYKLLPDPEMLDEDFDEAKILASISYLEKELSELELRINEIKESDNWKEVEELEKNGNAPEPILKLKKGISELEDKISSLLKEQQSLEEEMERSVSSSGKIFE
ncbi:MAG: hypothetical protein ABIA04_15405 [Pseudomonadota bacterium]